MQPNALNATAADLDLAVNDLGPLAWVLDELRKSLDGAAKALKRFVRDAEAARGSDLAAIDASQLRLARQQLHQAVGALEMVGLAGPALVLRSMEAAVQKFVQFPGQCTQEAAAKIERASFALTEYLECVLADKPISAVSLFPQYREVQELVRADRIHPADLWPNEWRWLDLQPAASTAPQPYGDNARSVFDQSVLQIMKGEAGRSALALKDLALSLAAGQSDRQPRIFWMIAAAYFEALAHGLIGADVYVRRAASRVLMQYLSLSKGNHGISERLVQDLLFFCSQAIAARASDTPVLSAVRATYGLARFRPVDYEAVQFGRFDPALLAQARKRIVSAKETWSSLSAGDANKFKQVVDQFSLVTDSLVKLHPPSEPLAQALNRAIDMTARSGKAPGIELSMEVATSVLYLEAAFDDLDPRDSQLAGRTLHLAERLEGVRAGGSPEPLESWMEELYRRVSDKQTMGSVVGELRLSLGELEKSLDTFFRNPQDKSVLRDVPGQLSQMRGVLSVLGLEQASQAVLRMRDSVEQMLVTEVDEQRARAAGTFDALGNNLGALSFLIDMLNYQPALAKKLFVYDVEKGELKPLMGRSNRQQDAAASVTVPGETLSEQPAAVVPDARAGAPEQNLTARLDALAIDTALAGLPAPVQTARDVSVAPASHDPAASANLMAGLVSTAAPAPAAVVAPAPAPVIAPVPAAIAAPAPAPVRAALPTPAPVSPALGSADFEDDELRDIFLEEAREVTANGIEALRCLATEPGDIGQLTILRRVFHTLKGSSRMVGLNELGEAGWSMEQMLNGWLADQKPASDELRQVAGGALSAFALWVEDIATGQAADWSASNFRIAADAMRVEGRLVHLSLPARHGQPIEVSASPAESAEHGITVLVSAEETTASTDLDFDAFFDFEPVVAQPLLSETTLQPADEATTIEEVVLFDIQNLEPEPAAESVGVNALGTTEAMPGAAMVAAQTPETTAPPDIAVPATAELDAQAQAPVLAVLEPQTLEAAYPDPADSLSIDLESLSAISELDNQVLAAGDVVAFAAELLPEVAGIEVPDLLLDGAEPSSGELDKEAELLELSAADFDEQFMQIGNRHPAALEPVAAVEEQEQEASEIQQSEPAFFDSAAEEQVKVIGDLRIGIPLYNVYLNEADEWSRRLVTDLSEWAIERHQRLGDSTVALAHSLAGSSATVGFDALSEIARALEHALLQSQTFRRNSATEEHAVLFVHAAEDIRRLLHQFAAGFLKTPDAGTVERLKNIEFTEQAFALQPDEDEFGISVDGESNGFADSVKLVASQANPVASPADTVVPAEAISPVEAKLEPVIEAPLVNLFVHAAEDIGRLLNQFTASFLKTPDAGTVERPKSIELAEQIVALPPVEESGLSADGESVDFADSVKLAATQASPAASPAATAGSAGTTDTVVPVEVIAVIEAKSEPVIDAPLVERRIIGLVQPVMSVRIPAIQVMAPPTAASQSDDEDDEFDAVDAIDAELFPIFEEEAAELIPQLGSAMRQWSARPNNQGARTEVLRVLHTLKGSARLAGALRLGEMAHKIESEIEFIGSESVTAGDFEPLLARLDALENNFVGLQAVDAAGVDAAATLAEPLALKRVTPAQVLASVEALTVAAETIVEPAIPVESLFIAPADVPAELLAAMQTETPTGRKVMIPAPQAMSMQPLRQAASATVRVRSQLLDRMVNQAGEVMITRSRLEVELGQLRSSLSDMNGNLNRLRQQLRDIELQAETQMQSRLAQAKEQAGFDPLEFDRFTRVQELTRMMAESVNDVATVQRTLQRTVEATEDDLIAQARQTRELQRDLLRTRMVEFEGISDRLYRVVRQASKETGKQVKLDLLGGTIEMDRGMLDRMTPAFEHLLRNCVAHGIESPEVRSRAGKEAAGLITVHLRQEGNDVSVDFSDDGAGLDLVRIRAKATALGMVAADQALSDSEAANLIFLPGFSTAAQVTELSGRGIGMDVVRSEVSGVGGRIETSTVAGKGTHFKLVLPLTTAVTQVVMVRAGSLSVGVPANVVEVVRRATAKELQQAYNSGFLEVGTESIPFFWSGALLQSSHRSSEVQGKTTPVVIFRSAAQRIALHVDEVLGNQEVVVKNLGPQLSRLPGLAGMSVLASGAVVLIYNPVALSTIYGKQARGWSRDIAEPHMLGSATANGGAIQSYSPIVVAPQIPLILVVDDSITVRRVTQRLLQREGYRVAMAADGLQALERLQEERPAVVLSDIEMPRMDGFDLARNIRADARLSGLPIVMITSRIAEKHREHAKELGVDHYLGKPYSEDELMSLVRHYCNAVAVIA
jgi:chemosensory pili system protein ChpA (sensor histidine kinase/response regulator)